MSGATQSRLSAVERARSYVAKIPGAIAGQHGDAQTLAVANVLVWDFGLAPSEALEIFREFNARCSPPWSEADLLRKLRSAERQPHRQPRGNRLDGGTPARPIRARVPGRADPVAATQEYLNGFRCSAADLVAASSCVIPPRLFGEHFHRQGAYLIDQLFHPGEQVNIVFRSLVDGNKARPADAGRTLERNAWETILLQPGWHGPGGAWVRMNPLDGRGAADTNVTAFRFALLECDTLPMELQLALFARLPLPIAAIITSGGRSVHAWVLVHADTLDEYREIVAKLLELVGRFGVDGNNKNPSRLSRLPGVIRKTGAEGGGRQTLLYLNPEPQQKAIL